MGDADLETSSASRNHHKTTAHCIYKLTNNILLSMRVQNYSEKANTNRKVYNYSTITSYTKANNVKYILKYWYLISQWFV